MPRCVLSKSSLVGHRKPATRRRRSAKCKPSTFYPIPSLSALTRIFQLYRDSKRVLECLQRALRVADACMDTAVSVELFVEILNRYVYYFEQQNEAVTTKYLNGLIELIHSNLQTNEDEPNPSLEGPKRHFERTLEYIRSREYDGVVTDPRQ